MLVAMESPISAVATRVASTNSALPSPTPLAMVRFSDCAGNAKFALRVKSPVIC